MNTKSIAYKTAASSLALTLGLTSCVRDANAQIAARIFPWQDMTPYQNKMAEIINTDMKCILRLEENNFVNNNSACASEVINAFAPWSGKIILANNIAQANKDASHFLGSDAIRTRNIELNNNIYDRMIQSIVYITEWKELLPEALNKIRHDTGVTYKFSDDFIKDLITHDPVYIKKQQQKAGYIVDAILFIGGFVGFGTFWGVEAASELGGLEGLGLEEAASEKALEKMIEKEGGETLFGSPK
jgi:hypothetical protein